MVIMCTLSVNYQGQAMLFPLMLTPLLYAANHCQSRIGCVEINTYILFKYAERVDLVMKVGGIS